MLKTVEEVKKRFQQEPKLCEFLPMLDEYIFSPQRVDWLCTADVEKVFSFCAEVDE